MMDIAVAFSARGPGFDPSNIISCSPLGHKVKPEMKVALSSVLELKKVMSQSTMGQYTFNFLTKESGFQLGYVCLKQHHQ